MIPVESRLNSSISNECHLSDCHSSDIHSSGYQSYGKRRWGEAYSPIPSLQKLHSAYWRVTNFDLTMIWGLDSERLFRLSES